MKKGMVMPLVLLIMAAISLLTLATLTLATHETRIAASRLRSAQISRQPARALRLLAREWPVLQAESMRVGAARTIIRGGSEIVLRRLSYGLFHARASSRSGAFAHNEAVYRVLDVERAFSDANEAVVSRGPIAAHQAILEVDDTSICVLPFLPPRPAVPLTVAARHHALGLTDVLVDSAHAQPPPGYALGGVRWAELPSIADQLLTGGSLSLNDPPTGDYPLLYAPGDLVLSGTGRGLLFVAGNLEVAPATVFQGIITVGGTLIVHDAAALTGAVRVLGDGLSAIGAARITHSRCLCAQALLTAPANRRLIKAERFFIPAF